MPSSQTVTTDQAKLLEVLRDRGEVSQQDLAQATKFDLVKVAREILALTEKGFVASIERTEQRILLTEEGKRYLKDGLPEHQVYAALQAEQEPIFLESFKQRAKIDEQLINIAIGWLKRKNWVSFTKEGKKTFLKLLERTEDIDTTTLRLIAEGKIAERLGEKAFAESVKNLKKRKLVEVLERHYRVARLTPEGKALLSKGLKVQQRLETMLTPEMIISGKWRKTKYKPYDPSEQVPPVYYGRRHPVIEVINEIREIFLEMGFSEIRGPLVESEFWNFDALFQPQDHPARELADTFKIARPTKAKLPAKDIVQNVKKTHEHGWKTKSSGWGYKWQMSEAERLVLRTHTTATTCRHLSKAYKEWEPPEKVFSVDRVYRNEAVDYSHLAEFMQIEGIVVDKNVNLRHLKGNLQTFYRKMGFKKVRLIPSFYPYTEPSMSTLIFVEKFNSWMEMGGSGIFRPEVTYPFGVKEKVLAWGQGLDRLVMLKLDLNDIREVYSINIERLRSTPVIF